MSDPRADSVERRLLEGDPDALVEVVRRIASVLTLPRFWRLRGEWSDLHQEVLTKVIQSLRAGRFDPARPFHAYVQGIARHTALHALDKRSARGGAGNPGTGTVPQEAGPEEAVVRDQLVRRVLDLASEECRELMRAHFLEEKSYAEIAAAKGIPVGTVKSRLFRCLESAHEAIRGARRRTARKAPLRPGERAAGDPLEPAAPAPEDSP